MIYLNQNEDLSQKSEIQRQTAYKICVDDILKSTYIKEQGWNPNYILLNNNLKVSRVNIIATLLSKENQIIVIDDGTGKIQVRSFEENKNLEHLSPGDLILVLGKVREFNSEKYILPEVTKLLNDQKWMILRKSEIEIQTKFFQDKGVPIVDKEEVISEKIEEEVKISKNPFDQILEKIKDLDKGNGVNIELIKNNVLDSEKVLKQLLEDGEIYEIRPGVVKVLE